MEKFKYEKSSELLERAKKVLAGGVSSEFRKYNHPHALFYTHAKGCHIYDVDGNDYLDFTLSQGPMILGHSHPKVLQAVNEYSEEGQLFAGQHIKEIQLAEKLNQLIPGAELIRFCLDGSEAVHTAFRVARAKTRRRKFLRFEGHYHGWLDNVAWGYAAPSVEALGSREYPNVFPWSEGLPENAKDEFILLPWNDLDLVKRTVSQHFEEIAAIITEPIMCNNGCIPPDEGFLQGLRNLCDEFGIALIFDEVITGFRLGLGGAQQYFGITPDLSIFAKAMGSGYPVSAIVGKKDWMKFIETSKVIHAGTMNSSNATIAASLATIEVLEEEKPYKRLFQYGKKLKEGLQDAASDTGQNLLVQGFGPIVHSGFTNLEKIGNYRDTFSFDKPKLAKFIAGLHNKGIRVIGRGLWYIGTAHTEKDIDNAINTVKEVLGAIQN
jgi:glutamate-1-semialdehyde 2,1-aminomutase